MAEEINDNIEEGMNEEIEEIEDGVEDIDDRLAEEVIEEGI